jgi:hypothetical protein
MIRTCPDQAFVMSIYFSIKRKDRGGKPGKAGTFSPDTKFPQKELFSASSLW